jgi:hypothetical protein
MFGGWVKGPECLCRVATKTTLLPTVCMPRIVCALHAIRMTSTKSWCWSRWPRLGDASPNIWKPLTRTDATVRGVAATRAVLSQLECARGQAAFSGGCQPARPTPAGDLRPCARPRLLPGAIKARVASKTPAARDTRDAGQPRDSGDAAAITIPNTSTALRANAKTTLASNTAAPSFTHTLEANLLC